MSNVLKRLREPSTWAGVGAILVAFGLDGAIIDSFVKVAIAIVGVFAVLLPEGTSA